MKARRTTPANLFERAPRKTAPEKTNTLAFSEAKTSGISGKKAVRYLALRLEPTARRIFSLAAGGGARFGGPTQQGMVRRHRLPSRVRAAACVRLFFNNLRVTDNARARCSAPRRMGRGESAVARGASCVALCSPARALAWTPWPLVRLPRGFPGVFGRRRNAHKCRYHLRFAPGVAVNARSTSVRQWGGKTETCFRFQKSRQATFGVAAGNSETDSWARFRKLEGGERAQEVPARGREKRSRDAVGRRRVACCYSSAVVGDEVPSTGQRSASAAAVGGWQ
jgi:hypothetical protein